MSETILKDYAEELKTIKTHIDFFLISNYDKLELEFVETQIKMMPLIVEHMKKLT